ncbi:hypothetical protein G9A89_002250 [Geosiphon pyriformis]|nr:hypothetical protein G9A89_002250 [Geosiphon pyriformis]
MATNQVAIADKDAIKEALLVKDFPKHENYKLIRRLTETMFTSSDKNFVKKRRRTLSPAFSIKFISSIEPLMHKCFQDVVTFIDTGIKNSPPKEGFVLDLYKLNKNWTLDVIGETSFGGSFKIVQNGDNRLQTAIRHNLTWGLLFTENIMQKRRQQKSESHMDLLQKLLDSDLEDDEIIDQSLEFLIAGSDTNSHTLSMAMISLIQNPDQLEKLHQELVSELGSPNSTDLPQHEKLKRLPFLNAVLNETFRLYPAGLVSMRSVTEDWLVNGYLIPKGTILNLSIYQLHTSAEYWGDDVAKFKPERWLNPEKLPTDVFYPFGAETMFYRFSSFMDNLQVKINVFLGSRMCFGIKKYLEENYLTFILTLPTFPSYAMQQIRIALAIFVHRYQFEEISGQNLDILQYVTPVLKTGTYNVRVFARD